MQLYRLILSESLFYILLSDKSDCAEILHSSAVFKIKFLGKLSEKSVNKKDFLKMINCTVVFTTKFRHFPSHKDISGSDIVIIPGIL